VSRVEHSYTILLPVSGEAFGRWLDENHATVEISCALGTYHVRVNRHRLDSFKESGNVSVRRCGDLEVSAYSKTLEEALLTAMQKCMEEPFK
jgi:hypothetical protein